MSKFTINNSVENIRRHMLEQKLQSEILLLDGATGTELERRGVDISLPLWSAHAILDAPEILMQIHLDYLLAGANIITANTFRTHRHNLASSGMDDQATSMTQQAVAIAQKAISLSNKTSAFVAGSIAPLGDSYTPENTLSERKLNKEHRLMSKILVSSGVDLLLVETMSTILEAVIATSSAISTGCPTFISLVCNRDGSLLSGESLHDAIASLLPLNPHAMLIN
ncbi:MAG: homocysteine S-methyltransferase family protein, partial [Chloroflexota bacterium]|nr:homocysteine S-methyltransferase family protein [Chloroflexota bacterium]